MMGDEKIVPTTNGLLRATSGDEQQRRAARNTSFVLMLTAVVKQELRRFWPWPWPSSRSQQTTSGAHSAADAMNSVNFSVCSLPAAPRPALLVSQRVSSS